VFAIYDELPFLDQFLHGIHFMLCAFAVLIACVPLLTEKGSVEHKFGGTLYMPVSIAAFTLASYMAWRESSLLLLCFNVFCAYLLLSGWRAMHEKEKPVLIDWLIPGGLFLLACGVALHAVIDDEGRRSLYLLFFAFNSFCLVVRDYRYLRRRMSRQRYKAFPPDGAGIGAASEWLNRHIAGMVGSVIANLSVVVLMLLPLDLHWIWPAALIVAAAAIAWQQHRKKARIQANIAAIFTPDFKAGKRMRMPRKENLRRAA
jgi:hypothetical protein